MGGPIKKDRAWFFGSARTFHLDTLPADALVSIPGTTLPYCDQTERGIPFRTQFKIAGTVPVAYGIQVGVSFQSLPGYRYGEAALSAADGVGALVDPGTPVASLSVPLVAPMTEYGDRINQLDINVSKTIKINRFSVQPKFDLYNALNVSPVYAVRSLNYGTSSYNKPSSILNGRVFQLGAVVKS